MAVFFGKKEARRVDSISSRGLLNQSSGSAAQKPGLAEHNSQRAPSMALWRERWPVKSVQSAGASICDAHFIAGVPVLVECAL